MGSASKIILIGATSLIIGIYAVALKKVQTDEILTALVDVKRVQFEQAQATAVATAMDLFVIYGCKTLSGSRNALGGGTYSYSFSRPTHWNGTAWVPDNIYADLTLTATLDGVPRVITARVEDTSLRSDPSQRFVKKGPRKIHRGRWEVTKYYVAREH
ncbi:MAG: hypothetical protein NTU47_03915 [Ignavibacteriales bacterium]|nr:hypothetical protein [Ignavibacteriales bacterium]